MTNDKTKFIPAIYDWFCLKEDEYCEKPLQCKAVTTCEVYCDEGVFNLDEIKPVPLRSGYFTLNGFQKVGLNFLFEDETGNCALVEREYILDWCYFCFSVQFQSVHELQSILRVQGLECLERLANNFKAY